MNRSLQLPDHHARRMHIGINRKSNIHTVFSIEELDYKSMLKRGSHAWFIWSLNDSVSVGLIDLASENMREIEKIKKNDNGLCIFSGSFGKFRVSSFVLSKLFG